MSDPAFLLLKKHYLREEPSMPSDNIPVIRVPDLTPLERRLDGDMIAELRKENAQLLRENELLREFVYCLERYRPQMGIPFGPFFDYEREKLSQSMRKTESPR